MRAGYFKAAHQYREGGLAAADAKARCRYVLPVIAGHRTVRSRRRPLAELTGIVSGNPGLAPGVGRMPLRPRHARRNNIELGDALKMPSLTV